MNEFIPDGYREIGQHDVIEVTDILRVRNSLSSKTRSVRWWEPFTGMSMCVGKTPWQAWKHSWDFFIVIRPLEKFYHMCLNRVYIRKLEQ